MIAPISRRSGAPANGQSARLIEQAVAAAIARTLANAAARQTDGPGLDAPTAPIVASVRIRAT